MHKASYNHNHVLNDNSFTGCCLDCERSFKTIKTHILDFHEEIKGCTYSSLSYLPVDELYRKYQLLDDITKLKGGDNLSRMVLNDTSIKGILPYVREFYKSFFEIHEKHLANEILLSSTPWAILDNFELFPRYRRLIKNQLDLFDMKEKERIIFIGCGPLPVSLIVLKKYFNIDSIGVDSDSDAVALANKCLKKLGFNKGINIIHGDESIIKKYSASRVVIAAMAVPKKRIFDKLRLLTEGEKDLKIIYRTYTGLRTLLHLPVSSNDIRGFTKVNEIQHSGKINNTLVLLAPDTPERLNREEHKEKPQSSQKTILKLLQFTEVKELLIEIYNRIKEFSDIEIIRNSSDSINDQFKILDSLAAVPINDSCVRKLEEDPVLMPALLEISRFRKLFNIKLELERTDLIINSNEPWKTIKNFTFYKNYLKLAEMEVEGAKLKKGDHIVFIGSGPLPLSLIMLCKHYGLTGTGIEQEQKYVNISKCLISKLNISDKINFIHGNHFNLPLQIKTKLIMIAAAAVPKQGIFAHLHKVLEKGTKVSYRIYEKGLRKFLDVDSCMLNNNFDVTVGELKEYRRIRPEPPVNNTCVFINI